MRPADSHRASENTAKTLPGDRRANRGVKALILLAILASFTGLIVLRPPRTLSAGFAIEEPMSSAVSSEPIFNYHFASDGLTAFVHSATAAEMGDGRIRAFWLGGTRESHADVDIYTAVYDPATHAWSPETVSIRREWVKQHLSRNVIALGNPVAMRHEDGRFLLWFVSVSVGGWSGSAINMAVSHDDGETWQPPARLITSPMFNISTLVKQPPFMFADGTIGLPAYHENMAKFGELLRLDSHGRVLHKQRLSWGRSTLQPTIVPRSPLEATGFLRRAGSAPRHGIAFATSDGGRTWSTPRMLDMPNSSAPISAVRLDDGDLLLAFNNTQRWRDRLSLAISSTEGETYSVIQEIDGVDKQKRGISYPFLLRTQSGDFHLLYTWYRERIKHVHFNAAWLEQHR